MNHRRTIMNHRNDTSDNRRTARERTRRAASNTRAFLRRVMPRVALAAVVMFVVWLLVNDRPFYRDSTITGWYGFLTFMVSTATLIYYGWWAMSWAKRKLLWRVRRRLAITYIFIGLTPIVLLAVLGIFAAMVGSQQAMVRIVAAEIKATDQHVRTSARTLAEELNRLPANASDQAVRAWLEERMTFVRATLPGAGVAVWRDDVDESMVAPERTQRAQFVNQQLNEDTRCVGPDAGEIDGPLPEWLDGQNEWSGLAFLPPPDDKSDNMFGSPSLRTVVRTQDDRVTTTVLLVVPVSRALVRHLRESTDVNVRPFFIGADIFNPQRGDDTRSNDSAGADEINVQATVNDEIVLTTNEQPRPRDFDPTFSHDQFGEPLSTKPLFDFWYPVLLPATNWLDGERSSDRTTFVIDWSWAKAGKQFFGGSQIGDFWRKALIVVGVGFLMLELFALFSAAWMTRAVTGTVHQLHRATEFIRRGDFSHRVHVRSHDQLGELAQAFNDMSANIESLLQERVEHERLEREVEIAAQVQGQLFPRRVPKLATVEVAGECRAARGVAGDYYDYIEVAPGFVAFALGDVSGKGLSASLVMSNLQAALRAQTTIIAERLRSARRAAAAGVTAGSHSTGATGKLDLAFPCGVTELDDDENCAVAKMAARINEQLCQSTESNRFATLFLALYDDRARSLRYTNAGHNAAILMRADGRTEQLSRGGTMIGAFDWSEFEEGHTALQPEDLLVIFSDGISEAQNIDGEEYGEARLTQLITGHRAASVEDVRRAIFAAVDNWSGGQERGDDQTLVVVKCKGA